MTLFGSRACLIFFITSKPPPSSSGTRSTSPSRERAVRDGGVLAVPAHGDDLAAPRAPVERCRVAVVARRPVGLGDLVAQVRAAARLADPAGLLCGGGAP